MIKACKTQHWTLAMCFRFWGMSNPTAVGAVSSAVAVRVASRRWFSFLRCSIEPCKQFQASSRVVRGLFLFRLSAGRWQHFWFCSLHVFSFSEFAFL